ncbi:MAG: hypothetical protein ACOYD7_05290 [Raoultibacter sp.]|jgi:transcriptional regulator with XRE-family HTH domain
MLFDEKLDLILTALGIKNIDLANKVGVDPSLISRIRAGKRKKPSKQQFLVALSGAIAELSSPEINTETLPYELSERISASSIKRSDFEKLLLMWFVEEEESATKPEPGTSSSRVFGEKLSALLEIADVTNAQIARALNVDLSLVSLYRSGTRFPAARSATIESISSFFARQNLNETQEKILRETIGYEGDAKDSEALQVAIMTWLSIESKDVLSSESDSVESFLERVDSFGEFAAGRTVIPLEIIEQSALDGNEPAVLFGFEGIQKAAVSYLVHVARQDSPQTLHHFSDQSTEWMLGNPEYAKVWASLMVHVLSRGHKLRIIHTVNRDSTELFSAMENWIPLYMIGEITPYYFRSGSSGRFRTSHFLAEDLALISGYCAPEMESRAVYRYDTDPHIVACAKEQFDGLLSQCSELMKVYKGRTDEESYRIHLNAFWGRRGNVVSLLPRLSLATIPQDLFRAILDRLGIDSESVSLLLETQAEQARVLKRMLESSELEELCVLESMDSVQGGEVYLDIPPNLLDEPVAYSCEEYQAHVRHIEQLEAENPGYRFIPLEQSPFRNIRIFCKENGRSIVEKLSVPSMAFSFNNPHMCRGISHFLHKLKEDAR